MGQENNSAVSAPAPVEVEKIHDSLLTSLDSYAKAPTPETFVPIGEIINTYKTARTKFQGELKAYQEAEAKKNAPPDQYQIEMPKDSPLGADYAQTLLALGKEKKMTQAQLTATLADRDQTVRGFLEKRAAQFNDLIKRNQETLKAHPVLGKDLAATEGMCTAFIETYGRPAADGKPSTLETLKKSGALMDPEIVEMIFKAAKALGPERLVMSKSATSVKPAVNPGVGTDTPPQGFSQVSTNLPAATAK